MPNQTESKRIFSLNLEFRDPLQNKLFSMVKGPIEHVLSFPRMNRAYADIARMSDNRPFPEKVLERLQVGYDLAEEDAVRLMIPSGPVIVVANHPFGGIEGIILASLLRSLRCDVKFLANYLLNAVPEMREMLIPVNPFKGGTSVRDNIRPVRESIQWVRNGGMLVVFPSGTVSYFDLQKGAVLDPAWSPTLARLVRATGAPVLPVFFQGANSVAFHMAGLVHPALRTAMLPSELMNKSRKTIRVRAGDLIPFDKLADFRDDGDMTEYLRLRTYLPALRSGRQGGRAGTVFQPLTKRKGPGEIMASQDPDVMAEEIRRLSPGQRLAESNEFDVIQATSEQIPHLLLEIGRLREITFRAVGEGTGMAVDLDRFDRSYTHLFIWNREKKEVVGSYRIGRADELVRKQGMGGLYTSTLFRYHPGFFGRLGPALELGRSFVRPEYQKSYAPLLLLWKGIGGFIVEHPWYKTLFGPVSITDEYQALSKHLMVGYLKQLHYRRDLAAFVMPRKPLRPKPLRGWDIDAAVRLLRDDLENLTDLISCVEGNHRGIPVLLRQYLKLGGEIAGFNVDPSFGNALDGLIIVDLTRTEPKMLERYLGRDGCRRFLAAHERPDRKQRAVPA